MSDFYQDGTISTLHDFGTKSTKDLEKDLDKVLELIIIGYLLIYFPIVTKTTPAFCIDNICI